MTKDEQQLNCYAMDVWDTPYNTKRLNRFLDSYQKIASSPRAKQIYDSLKQLLSERHIHLSRLI